MPCFSPLQGYRAISRNPSGKRGIVFNPKHGYRDMPVQVPCGQCRGCRLERSRQWAMRCYHESTLYPENSFITLTYNDDNLPAGGTLVKSHYQKFMKRLRKHNPGVKIRYFQCGEYGDKNRRPHYHACLFNFDFKDKIPWKEENGTTLYISAELTQLWPYGFSTIGEVTFDSAAYVARYIMKKLNGKKAEDVNPETGLKHYENYDSQSGEIIPIQPEYTTMSRRPGIAADWYDQYKDDVYPSDFVVINGKRMRPSKFYDSILERTHQDEYERIKAKRKRKAKNYASDNTPERLAVRERVKTLQIKTLTREL